MGARRVPFGAQACGITGQPKLKITNTKKMRCGFWYGQVGSNTGYQCNNELQHGEKCQDHPDAPQKMWDLGTIIDYRNAVAAPGAVGGNNLRRLAAAPNSSSSLCSAGILSAGLVVGFVLSKLVKCSSRRRQSTEVYYHQ